MPQKSAKDYVKDGTESQKKYNTNKYDSYSDEEFERNDEEQESHSDLNNNQQDNSSQQRLSRKYD